MYKSAKEELCCNAVGMAVSEAKLILFAIEIIATQIVDACYCFLVGFV